MTNSLTLHGAARHLPIEPSVELLRRFMENVAPGACADGCVLWQGRINRKGYGSFTSPFDRNADLRAHRVAYVLFVGPIPDELNLDHLCRNRACVNPFHLEAVTHRTNILRGVAPPAANARKTHCSRGHELAGANLKIIQGRWRRCRQCERDYKREWQRRMRAA